MRHPFARGRAPVGKDGGEAGCVPAKLIAYPLDEQGWRQTRYDGVAPWPVNSTRQQPPT